MDPFTSLLLIWAANLVLEQAVMPALANGKARPVDCGALGTLALTPQELQTLNAAYPGPAGAK